MKFRLILKQIKIFTKSIDLPSFCIRIRIRTRTRCLLFIIALPFFLQIDFIIERQPRPNDLKYVRVVDFGTGGYATDYTGHAFLESYVYERQQFMLNNTFEYSSFWKRPFNIEEYKPSVVADINANKLLSGDDSTYKDQKIDFVYSQGQQNAYNYYKPDLNVEYLNNQNPNLQQQQQQTQQTQQNTNINNNINPSVNDIILNNPNIHYHNPNQPNPANSYANQFQNQQLQDPNVLPITLKPHVQSLDQFSPYVYQFKDKVPITSWDPIVDNDRNNLNRYPDRNSVMGFDQWYINSINQNIGLENLKNLDENPFVLKTLKYIDTYRFAQVWWQNESYFLDNKQELVI